MYDRVWGLEEWDRRGGWDFKLESESGYYLEIIFESIDLK